VFKCKKSKIMKVKLYAVLLGLTCLTSYSQKDVDINVEAVSDWSGYSVSLSDDGTTLAIGAHYDTGNGSESGHVGVYKKNKEGIWSQIGLDINGEVAGDWSGYSISLSNNGATVAIGAVHNNSSGIKSGHVRVYKNEEGIWNQIGVDIDGEEAGDWSGYSVNLSGDGTTVAIGAIFNSGNSTNSGHVRVYKNISGSWVQIGGDIDGKAAKDYLGASVSLSNDGNILAIGAHQGGAESGYVSVYKNSMEQWVQIGADIKGEIAGNFSGWSVSMSGDGAIVAVGAYKNNNKGVRSGYVRVYENSSNTWVQKGADINNNTVGGDLSGFNVSMSDENTIIVIGAYEKDSANKEDRLGVGYVRVYEYRGGSSTWNQVSSDIYICRSNG